jgi:hypothetical protein
MSAISITLLILSDV